VLLPNGSSVSLAPQAYSETSPIAFQGYFLPQTGLQLETRYATYAALYKEQPYVAAAVNKIGNLVARLGIDVWDEASDTGKTMDLKGPYARLISNPCPYMPPYSFWLWIASTFEIYGEAFLIKLRDEATGRVTGLVPMHPSRTEIRREDDGRLSYRFMGQGEMSWVDESEIVPFLSFNPDGGMRGWSRLEPLRSTLMNEDSARRATASWWKNMGRPSMILSSPDKMSFDAKSRLGESFSAAHGGSTNAGGTVVLSDGITATQMQLSAEEMQYIESRKLNREEVCGVYDLPPTALHIMDSATYSNITEQMRSVYRDSIAPRLEFIESVLDTHLGNSFTGAKYARFDLGAVLRGDFETRAEAIAPLVQSGIYKPSEARELFDLNDAGPTADVLYANAAIQPLGEPAETLSLTGTALTSPDGVPLSQPPLAVLPAALPVLGAKPKPKALTPAAMRYERHLRGGLGRGTSLHDCAVELLAKYPDGQADIAAATERISSGHHR
jgi:HK97 family phage portal protein